MGTLLILVPIPSVPLKFSFLCVARVASSDMGCNILLNRLAVLVTVAANFVMAIEVFEKGVYGRNKTVSNVHRRVIHLFMQRNGTSEQDVLTKIW